MARDDDDNFTRHSRTTLAQEYFNTVQVIFTHLDAREGLLQGVVHCQVGLDISVSHRVVGSLLRLAFALLV